MAAASSAPAPGNPILSWRRWTVILASLAVIGLGVFLGWNKLQAKADRDEALRIAKKGDFARSEPLLLQVAKRHPDDTTVAKELALGYFHADRFAEAEPFFEQWCQANPNDPEPYTKRIGLWMAWKRVPSAVADAHHVLKLQPDNRKLQQHLTRWILMTGELAEAEQECQRFLDSWPGDPWVLLILAMVYQRQDRPRESAIIADQLVREFPDFPEALVFRGTLYCFTNQPAEAIPWLRRAAAMEGEHRRDALYELAPALDRIGQKEEAEQVMNEARLLQEQHFLREYRDFIPLNANAQARLADEMLKAGKSEEGLRLLAQLLEKSPNCAAAHRVLADYYEKQGQPDRAAEHRRREGGTP
jgi:predicted Zn-dependent protease